MRIILTAIEDGLYDAWNRHCGNLDGVEVFKGSILDCGATAIVSPANSFGFMDGGIDQVYLDKFGDDLQRGVRECIQSDWRGEIPVGCAFSVTGGVIGSRSLIVAPTMRVPMVLPEDTVNPYLASSAAMQCAQELKISSLAFPGMGTGVGRVPFDVCARQMRQAILDSRTPFNPSMVGEAIVKHCQLARITVDKLHSQA